MVEAFRHIIKAGKEAANKAAEIAAQNTGDRRPNVLQPPHEIRIGRVSRPAERKPRGPWVS